MKILGFKSNSVTEKLDITTNTENINSVKKLNGVSSTSQKIDVKNFDEIAAKISIEEEIDMAKLDKLREELKASPVTSENLADALINYTKNNSWHKRL